MSQLQAAAVQPVALRVGRAFARVVIAGPLAVLGLELFYSSQTLSLHFQGGPSIVFGILAGVMAIALGGSRGRLGKLRLFRWALIACLLTSISTRSHLVFGNEGGAMGPVAWLSSSLGLCLLAAGVACSWVRVPFGAADPAKSKGENSQSKALQRLSKLLWITVLCSYAVSIAPYVFLQDADARFMLGLSMYFVLHLGLIFLATWIALVQDAPMPGGSARIAAILLYPIIALAFALAFPLAIWRHWL